MTDSALPARTHTDPPPTRREFVDLDAMFPPIAVTDPDGAMADLGRRVQDQHPGAAVTAAGVRAIRESWARPSLWRRLVVRMTVR